MGCTQSANTQTAEAPTATNTSSKADAAFLQEQPASGSAMEATTAAAENGPMSNKLAMGAGCYWGTEKYIRKDFQKKFPNSIKVAQVGFMSPEETPRIAKPTYKQVCRGDSGHVEVLYVELNDPEKHFEELCKFFFSFHDPTTLDRQGNDRGPQYSSWIFCDDANQTQIAERVKGELQQALTAGKVQTFGSRKVVTKIGPLRKFTKAQAAHQEYLSKNPNGYCNHRIRLKEWPSMEN